MRPFHRLVACLLPVTFTLAHAFPSPPSDISTSSHDRDHDVFVPLSLPCHQCSTPEDQILLNLRIHANSTSCTDDHLSINGAVLQQTWDGTHAHGSGPIRTILSDSLREHEVNADWESTCVASGLDGEHVQILALTAVPREQIRPARTASGFTISFRPGTDPVVLRASQSITALPKDELVIQSWVNPSPADQFLLSTAEQPSLSALENELQQLHDLKHNAAELHQLIQEKKAGIRKLLKQDLTTFKSQLQECDSLRCVWKNVIDKVPQVAQSLASYFQHPIGLSPAAGWHHSSHAGADPFQLHHKHALPPHESGHTSRPHPPAEMPFVAGEVVDEHDHKEEESHAPPPPPSLDSHHDEHKAPFIELLEFPPPPPSPKHEGKVFEPGHPQPPLPPPTLEKPSQDAHGHLTPPPSGAEDHHHESHGPPPPGPPPDHHGPPPPGPPPDHQGPSHHPNPSIPPPPPGPHHGPRHIPHITGGVLVTALIVALLFSLLRHRLLSPQRRAEKAFRREERQRRRAYTRAACRHKWVSRWNRYRHPSSPGDYDEKRAHILEQEGILEDVMQAEIHDLQRAHDIVGNMVRAREAHGQSCPTRNINITPAELEAGPSCSSLPSSTNTTTCTSSQLNTTHYTPPSSYTHASTSDSDIDDIPPPRYSEDLSGDLRVVDGFMYTPSATDETPDSSIVDCTPRLSFDTSSARTRSCGRDRAGSDISKGARTSSEDES